MYTIITFKVKMTLFSGIYTCRLVVQYSSHPSLQSDSCSHKDFKKSLRNLTISYRVHEKCMSSRMHGKIFTTHEGYSSIETHAGATITNKHVMPHVVCTSRYLDQEKHTGAYICIYTLVPMYITILFAHSYKSTITPLRFNLPNAVSEDVTPQT